jgi:hypothetical protein
VVSDEVTRGRLGVGKVLRVAAHAYRRWFWRLAFTAAVVFGATAVLGVTVDAAIESVKHLAPGALRAALALYVLVGQFFGTLALVFYAGFLDLYVGDALYEGREVTLGRVLRTLPYKRLIVADVILAAVTQVGWLLLVVPGLFVFTVFALVGPLIIVEGHGIRPAFVRSRTLVMRHFWLVAGVVTLPVLAEGFVVHGIHGLFGLEHIWGLLLVSALVGIVVGSYCGLMEVIIARELVGAHPLDDGPAAGPGESGRRPVSGE